ncbi:sensor domain-containing protein [Desulfogranum japonicum]|uniref:sensor domain-containing protein n=1 Tax=Desulfogranum japonicum TaxID=231447 RepID=UPI00137730BE|nr:bifunctional diguanylate cyclase/phosphodiesterase [Desulfogranum japonicum]
MALHENVINQVMDSSPVALFVLNMQHEIVYWNHACEVITGHSATDMTGTNEAWKAFYSQPRPVMADLIVDGKTEDIPTYYLGKIKRSPIQEDTWEAENFFDHFPGGGRWLAFSAKPLRDSNGQLIGAIETLRDITTEKQAFLDMEASQRMLQEVIDGSPVPMFVLDRKHRISHWNRACEAITGVMSEKVVGTGKQWKAFYEEKRPVLADLVMQGNTYEIPEYYQGGCQRSDVIKDAWESTAYFPHFPSGPKWLYFTAAPLRDKDEQCIGAVETLQDVTAQKLYEQELAHQANHDSLTGLANRSLLDTLLKKEVVQAQRSETILAVLFIDLDNFKQINDTLGHSIGDRVIRLIGQRIAGSVRDVDTVARIGGDEYVVLLHEPESQLFITRAVHRILGAVQEKFSINNQPLHIGCSIGVAVYPKDGETASALMMYADVAMYKAKEKHKGGFCYFQSEMTEQARLWLNLKQDLHQAELRNEFELYYQPQYSLQDQRIIGAEALIRWNHPTQGMLHPGTFVPIAEETGLILPIGAWVVETAVSEACRWRNEIGTDIRLSVNISARQFRYDELVKMLLQIVERSHFHPFFLELELTESLVMENPARAVKILAVLKEKGFSLAMDDFGTGYSSLAYLRRFPFDMIKIDKSFVDDVGRNREAEAIITAMLNLGQALGLRMVAEGVETEEQLDFLRSRGCHEIQGFFYSKPLKAEDFFTLLKDGGTRV